MSNDVVVPEPMEAVIQIIDGDPANVTEQMVYQALNAAGPDAQTLSKLERRGAYAEVLVFGLIPNCAATSPWGTYFGPIGSAKDKDGRRVYFPDIAEVDAGIISHWKARARSVKHPILKARYADAAWEFGPIINDDRRDADLARIASDAYRAFLSTAPPANLDTKIEAAMRALQLSILINDTQRVGDARAVLLELHREAVTTRSQWWSTFDCLIENKRAGLTDAERTEMLQSLEELLRDFSDSSNSATFNPHDVESVSKRLIRIYRKSGKADDVKRLHIVIARTFEHFASLADSMLASVVLQTAINAYRDAGMQDESARTRILMQQKIGASRDEMAPIVTEFVIKDEEIAEFLTSVVVDRLGDTFVNVAARFLCHRRQLEDIIDAVAKEAPLQAFLPQTIMTDDHVAAKVGSVTEDRNGRVLLQTKLNFALDELWLHQALARTIERHSAQPRHFVGWANRLGLFDDVSFLLEGVNAWYEGDFTKALHVLVPQIEAGLRNIVGKLGKPVTKQHYTLPGIGVSINMGDILNNRGIVEALGPDMSLHFLALYADPRGMNLRNNLAHGLIKPESVSIAPVNWVIHSLLLFGIWDTLTEKRR